MYLRREDLNLRMAESKSDALPLGYTPNNISINDNKHITKKQVSKEAKIGNLLYY